MGALSHELRERENYKCQITSYRTSGLCLIINANANELKDDCLSMLIDITAVRFIYFQFPFTSASRHSLVSLYSQQSMITFSISRLHTGDDMMLSLPRAASLCKPSLSYYWLPSRRLRILR